MMNRVKEVAVKIEPIVLAFATFGAIEVWYTIYKTMWDAHTIDVIASGLLFFGAVASWWLDFFERKMVRKLLDNF